MTSPGNTFSVPSTLNAPSGSDSTSYLLSSTPKNSRTCERRPRSGARSIENRICVIAGTVGSAGIAPAKDGISSKMVPRLPLGQYAEKQRYTRMFPFDVADDAGLFRIKFALHFSKRNELSAWRADRRQAP